MLIDVYKGNENVFLILTGMGGSTKGFQNKYVTIAENINKKYGWTVFVVATQSGAWNDERKLDGFFGRAEIEDFHVKGQCSNQKGYFMQQCPCIGTCSHFKKHPVIK